MRTYVITGMVDGMSISETIQNISPYAPEALCTAKRNIINQFKKMEYKEEDIHFEQKEYEQ